MTRRRNRTRIDPLHGWRDSPPDLTTGEHDLMVATLQKAWFDVQIDPDSVPPSRREEAVAVKITAYEWLTWSDELYRAFGLVPPRMSFAGVCLQLDLNPESVRAVILRGIDPPKERVSERWRKFFSGRDTRVDRGWKRHQDPECPVLDDADPGPEHSLDTLRRAVVLREHPKPSLGTSDDEEDEAR